MFSDLYPKFLMLFVYCIWQMKSQGTYMCLVSTNHKIFCVNVSKQVLNETMLCALCNLSTQFLNKPNLLRMCFQMSMEDLFTFRLNNRKPTACFLAEIVELKITLQHHFLVAARHKPWGFFVSMQNFSLKSEWFSFRN